MDKFVKLLQVNLEACAFNLSSVEIKTKNMEPRFGTWNSPKTNPGWARKSPLTFPSIQAASSSPPSFPPATTRAISCLTASSGTRKERPAASSRATSASSDLESSGTWSEILRPSTASKVALRASREPQPGMDSMCCSASISTGWQQMVCGDKESRG